MAGGASMNAIQQPRWMEVALEEDFPQDAGTISKVCGYIGLALVVGRVLITVLSLASLFAE